jgi:hypothetical protein
MINKANKRYETKRIHLSRELGYEGEEENNKGIIANRPIQGTKEISSERRLPRSHHPLVQMETPDE